MHLYIKNTLKNNYHRTPKHLEAIPALIYFYLGSVFFIIINMDVRISLCTS